MWLVQCGSIRCGVLEYIVFHFACEVLFFLKYFVDGYLYRSFPIKKHSPFLSHKTTERFPEPLPYPNIAVRLLDTVAAEGIGDCSKTHHKSRVWPFQKWYRIRKGSKTIILFCISGVYASGYTRPIPDFITSFYPFGWEIVVWSLVELIMRDLIFMSTPAVLVLYSLTEHMLRT